MPEEVCYIVIIRETKMLFQPKIEQIYLSQKPKLFSHVCLFCCCFFYIPVDFVMYSAAALSG